jgi:hypothetical protein
MVLAQQASRTVMVSNSLTQVWIASRSMGGRADNRPDPRHARKRQLQRAGRCGGQEMLHMLRSFA